MDDIYQPLTVGLAALLFILVLAGIGEFYGGDWQTVAQGVTMFILIIVGFYVGAWTLMQLIGRRR